jgi:predicted nucleic acid-binding protein
VLAAYYVPEPLSARAERVLLELDDAAISVLTSAEFCSVLSRRRRERALAAADVQRALELHRSHVRSGALREIALGIAHWNRAQSLLLESRGPLATLDAVHLATALEEGLEIVTADRRLATAMHAAGGKARLVAT